MRKTTNKVYLNGRIYDHQLALKTVQNTESENFGKEFINGTLDIATDDECVNVVSVHFSYVTEFTKSGSKNATYAALKNIIDTNKTILTVGKDDAMMVKVNSAIDLNDFYTNRNGEETLVSAKRVEGGFVTIVSKLDPEEKERSKFECDMLIGNVRRVEADPEKHIDKDYVVLKGVIFNFRNAMLPVEFTVKAEAGMSFFENLDISNKNPVFTKVSGPIKCETVVTRKEEESAFGEPQIKEYTRTVREWIVAWTSKEENMYPIGDEVAGITAEEIQKGMADREVFLAGVKKRQDEYQASKNAGGGSVNTNPANAPASFGGFNF